MTDDFLLAHLTDPHLLPLPDMPWRNRASKRGLSLLSWRRRRWRLHLQAVSDALVADIRAAAPDHVAVTGDLTNFGLEAEFEAGAAWLAQLGPAPAISFVPGNHDAMMPGSWQAGAPHLAAWASGDDGAPGFPWIRRRGAIALIGLSTAIPTPPFFAHGRLGKAQIAAAGRLLAEAGREGRCRVVLLHHPPTGSCRPRKALRDRAAFRAMIARAGAELVLFGHSHRAEVACLDGPTHPALALGCPSASMRPGGRETAAAWRALCLRPEGQGRWRLEVRERGVDVEGRMVDHSRLVFVI